MKRNISSLVVITLFVGVASADAAETTFPVPKRAYDIGHVVLKDVGPKQDYYKIRLAYPSTEVVAHYRALFRSWWECSTTRGWESFGDVADGKNEYVHQLTYHWVPPSNDKVVTLGIRYVSRGIKSRDKPATNEQLVFLLLNEPIENAKAQTEQGGVLCAPNKALNPDVQKQRAG